MACKAGNLSYPSVPYTINNALAIHAGVAMSDDYGIHYFIVGNNKEAGVEPVRNPLNAQLYHQLPVRMIPEADDDLDRAVYGLKRIETYQNVRYAVYYAKALSRPEDVVHTTRDLYKGTQVGAPSMVLHSRYTPTEINPIYTSAHVQVTAELTAEDQASIRLYAALKYQDELQGVVREIGACIGSSKTIEGVSEMVGLTLAGSMNVNTHMPQGDEMWKINFGYAHAQA
jgi:hypothetical protein